MTLEQELKAAREAKDLSVEEVASTLRINKKYIHALEDGNYLLLPSQVHAKGFLKLYATFLGLDVKALTSELVSFYKGVEGARKTTATVKKKINIDYKKYSIYAASAIAIVLLLFLAYLGAKQIKRSIVTHQPAAPFEAAKVPVVIKAQAVAKKTQAPPKPAVTAETKVIKPIGGVVIKLTALKRTNAKVWVNNVMSFNSALEPGDIKTFTGKYIRVISDIGDAIRITRDGITYGTLGEGPGPAERNYGSTF